MNSQASTVAAVTESLHDDANKIIALNNSINGFLDNPVELLGMCSLFLRSSIM